MENFLISSCADSTEMEACDPVDLELMCTQLQHANQNTDVF